MLPGAFGCPLQAVSLSGSLLPSLLLLVAVSTSHTGYSLGWLLQDMQEGHRTAGRLLGWLGARKLSDKLASSRVFFVCVWGGIFVF